MAYLLGIDIGTSGTKSVLFDEGGRAVASHTVEYSFSQPKNGWAEQDPADWERAVFDGVAALLHKSGISAGDVAGVGLSGQMHGLVMLDREDRVLRPSIIWCDQRTAAECADITRLVGEKRLIEITANPALTGFTASKIMWVKKHEPELYEKCAKILLPKDYIRYLLTGEFATEVSDASGMQLLDVPKRAWSGEVLSDLGIDRALLGRVYESAEVTGRVTARAAARCGLAPGTPVVGGAGDQAAGAVGNGIVREGAVSSTIGTSGVVFAHTDRLTVDPLGRVHTFCHAVPGAWHVMGVTQGAGLSLKWFRDEFCRAEIESARGAGVDPYRLMDMEAERVSPGAGGLFYLPYMMGERTPHLDADARGVFFGLSALHTKRDLLRAVMEGVGYSLLDCMEVIRSMGAPASEVRASGGGGRSRLWRQMQADMFALPVTTVKSPEGGALGVALLAGVGAGIYSSVPEACDAAVSTGEALEPEAKAADVYREGHKLYRSLYFSLKGDFKALAAFHEKL